MSDLRSNSRERTILVRISFCTSNITYMVLCKFCSFWEWTQLLCTKFWHPLYRWCQITAINCWGLVAPFRARSSVHSLLEPVLNFRQFYPQSTSGVNGPCLGGVLKSCFFLKYFQKLAFQKLVFMKNHRYQARCVWVIGVIGPRGFARLQHWFIPPRYPATNKHED